MISEPRKPTEGEGKKVNDDIVNGASDIGKMLVDVAKGAGETLKDGAETVGNMTKEVAKGVADTAEKAKDKVAGKD